MAGVCLHSPVPALSLSHSIQGFRATTIYKQTTRTPLCVYATVYKERLKKERIMSRTMIVHARCKSVHFFPSSAKRPREMTSLYFTERERWMVFLLLHLELNAGFSYLRQHQTELDNCEVRRWNANSGFTRRCLLGRHHFLHEINQRPELNDNARSFQTETTSNE